MNRKNPSLTRRHLLISGLSTLAADALLHSDGRAAPAVTPKAQIAITLDLEMSRNFPRWEDTHWDYEKGNLNEAAKTYTREACRRVKARGGIVHCFVVGQVFEQADVDWLRQIVDEGHPIGNHTYDHVYVLAKDSKELQYRFRRAPWLIQGLSPAQVIRQNIQMTERALQSRIGIRSHGFRTPGGFSTGLVGRPDIQMLLQDLGFDWVSSKYPAHEIHDLHGTGRSPSAATIDSIVKAQQHAQPFVYPTGLVEIPMSPISDIGAFRSGRWQLDHFLDAVQQSLAWVIANRMAYDFLAHPSCLGVVDPEFKTIDLICDMVQSAGASAEIVDVGSLAKRVR